MSAPIDPSLHWTDHFVRYGFAVVKGLIEPEFRRAALARVRELVDNDLPPNEWTTENAPTWHKAFRDGEHDPVLNEVFDQPRLRAAIDELFGGDQWNRERNYYLFTKPYNPDAEPSLVQRGHIDFPNQPIPILYRGFNFQVSLIDTEPFSGNLTVHPGSHIGVQKRLIDNPDLRIKSGGIDDLSPPLSLEPPYEFVAEAGDVLFHSHLMVHSGNASHAANGTPRIALHCDCYRDEWLRQVDPTDTSHSPWELSLAQNGPYTMPQEQIDRFVEWRRQSGDRQYA